MSTSSAFQNSATLLEQMILIRSFEERKAASFAEGRFPGTCTFVGQEASAVGVVAALRPDDLILTNHRSAGHLLARGADPGRLMAEVMGRATGYCGGKSGTLHVSAKELGVILTSTIVGGELSRAPGVALSLSTKGSDAVVACSFGDGAACEGIFHESLNLAAVWKLPVLFVCENNEWQAFVHRRDRPAGRRPSGHRLRLRRGLPVALPRPVHDPRLRLRRTHAMRTITPYEAIGEALAEEMRRDATVLAFGEGIATKSRDLVAEFGAARVRNTPLAEGIIAGTAAGAAATGLRPVVDLLFAPFLTFSMEEIVNSAGKLRVLSGGQLSFPMVTMAMTGAGWGVGAQHDHNVEAWFVHSPGLKVVMPSAAADFKGLMKAAIRDDNPVLFFLDVALLHSPGEVPDGDHVVPLGKAAIRRSGTDVTLVSYAETVHNCVAASETLAAEGISAEVIDLRSLEPWDEEAVLASVRKTGRLVVVHEASRTCGVGAEIAATVAEKAFDSLRAPVVRLAGPTRRPRRAGSSSRRSSRRPTPSRARREEPRRGRSRWRRPEAATTSRTGTGGPVDTGQDHVLHGTSVPVADFGG